MASKIVSYSCAYDTPEKLSKPMHGKADAQILGSPAAAVSRMVLEELGFPSHPRTPSPTDASLRMTKEQSGIFSAADWKGIVGKRDV